MPVVARQVAKLLGDHCGLPTIMPPSMPGEASSSCHYEPPSSASSKTSLRLYPQRYIHASAEVVSQTM